MAKCEKCGVEIKDGYQWCWPCLQKIKAEEKEKGITHTNSANAVDVPELMKNLNTAVWRLVVYAEHLLVEKGVDPKQLRDDSWKRKQKEDEEPKDNPLQ